MPRPVCLPTHPIQRLLQPLDERAEFGPFQLVAVSVSEQVADRLCQGLFPASEPKM